MVLFRIYDINSLPLYSLVAGTFFYIFALERFLDFVDGAFGS